MTFTTPPIPITPPLRKSTSIRKNFPKLIALKKEYDAWIVKINSEGDYLDILLTLIEKLTEECSRTFEEDVSVGFSNRPVTGMVGDLEKIFGTFGLRLLSVSSFHGTFKSRRLKTKTPPPFQASVKPSHPSPLRPTC